MYATSIKNIYKMRILYLLLILFFTSIVHANGNNTGPKLIRYYKIDKFRLVVYAANGETFRDLTMCKDGTDEAIAVSIEASREEFNELYASVMLAHANSREIAFWLDGGCSPPTGGGPYPTVSTVFVY